MPLRSTSPVRSTVRSVRRAARVRTRWAVVFGPPLVVLLLAAGALLGLAQVREARRWVAHTREVLDATAQVQTAVLDAESGQRGYQLTGDRTYLASGVRAAAEGGVARLQTLTADNAGQQVRLARLARLVDAHFGTLDSLARFTAGGRGDVAREVLRAGAGRLRDTRAELAAVRGAELRLLAERQAREDRLTRLAGGGLALGALLAALLAAATNALLATHARRQAALAGAAAEHNEELQQQAAELEVQQLTLQEQAGELEAQAQQLAEQNAELGRTAERLTASEAHARDLVDTVPSGLVESDAAGRFVWANPAAERILRLPRAQITARDYAAPAWQTVAPDGAPLGPEALPVGRALATGAPVRGFEHAVVDPATGERVVLRVNVTPLRDAAGRVTGALSAFDDVTAEVQAQARLRRVAESGVVGLFSWTLAGGVIEANDAFLGMLGYTRDDLAAGRVDWRRMTPPSTPSATRRRWPSWWPPGRTARCARRTWGATAGRCRS